MRETQKWYEYVLLALTILLFFVYVISYLFASYQYGQLYLPLIMTARTIVLASFLIYFYNPLRTKYEYGHSLPLFAFTAGITLLLSLERYQVLDLFHFLIYGKTIPENPKKVCRLEEENPVLALPKV